MTLSPKSPMTAILLAAAAFYFLTQRKASAAVVTTAAIKPPAVGSFLKAPSTAAQYASYGQGRALIPSQGVNPITALIQAGSQLISSANLGTPFPGYATQYNANMLGTDRSAEYDGTAGESAARSYYLQHTDEFIPPPIDYNAVNSTPWAQAALIDPSEY